MCFVCSDRRVDEQVHPAEALLVLGNDADAVLFLADVGGDGVCADLRRGSLDLVLRARGERQLEALLAEHAGDREADARRAAGDQCAAHHATLKELTPLARIGAA